MQDLSALWFLLLMLLIADIMYFYIVVTVISLVITDVMRFINNLSQ